MFSSRSVMGINGSQPLEAFQLISHCRRITLNRKDTCDSRNCSMSVTEAHLLSFSESVCSDSVFRFGCADASVLSFETVGVPNMLGMVIECSMEFKNGNDSVTIPYGTFTVDSCPRDHKSMQHRKVTAYAQTVGDTVTHKKTGQRAKVTSKHTQYFKVFGGVRWVYGLDFGKSVTFAGAEMNGGEFLFEAIEKV